MYMPQTKGRFLRFFLVALILGFFAFPAITYCFLESKFPSYPKKIASVLVVFFR